MHELPPTPKQPRALRVAALFLALALLLLSGYVVWSGVQAGHRADVAVATLAQHDHDAARDRSEAAEDRTTAAANQRALLDYTATLAARQDALLAYLRAHGIHLPQRLVTVVPRPHIMVRGHHAGHHAKRHSKRRSSRTTVAPAGPGKSGSAPGHRKHRPH